MKKITTPSQLSPQMPAIILVRPQMAENVGMVARAMMNCGLYDLRIVSPRENHLSDKAISASSGASDILQKALIFNSLDEAIADLNFVLATTARERGMNKVVYTPEPAIKLMQDKTAQGQKCGILFGAERTGLENHELVMSDGIIEIPLNPLHCSLNLSQAVLLIGYEWFKSTDEKKSSEQSTNIPATKAELDFFLKHLENELEKRGYFRFFDKKERMQRNLRNIFTRNNLTTSEIRTLHSVVNDLIREEKHD